MLFTIIMVTKKGIKKKGIIIIIIGRRSRGRDISRVGDTNKLNSHLS